MWNMGEYNASVVAFFQAVHVMSGNGHFKLSTKEHGTFTLCDKFNSSGMDWSLGRIMELSQWVLDMAGINEPSQNLQGPTNVMSWTPVSLQLYTCASVRGNTLESMPEPSLEARSIFLPEMRAVDLSSFIQFAIARGAGGPPTLCLNTCDKNGDNLREAQTRRQITRMHIGGISFNTRKPNDEQFKTLGVVMARMPGGSGPYVKRLKTGGFNEGTSDSFGGRQSISDDQDAIARLLQYTNLFALVMPALLNKTSILPYDISPTSLAFLDWVSTWMKLHAGGTLETTVSESFKRMRDGYEARQVGKALWTSCIMLLPESDDMQDALTRVARTMHSNSLPTLEVVPAMHNLLSRGVNMACLLMAAVIAKHLETPVIDIDVLKRFFDDAQVIKSPTHCPARMADAPHREAFEGTPPAERPSRAREHEHERKGSETDRDLRSLESRLSDTECRLRRMEDALQSAYFAVRNGREFAPKPQQPFGRGYRGHRGR